MWLKLKPVLFLISLLPLARWIYLYSAQQLGQDPGLWLMSSSGQTTLSFLIITLCMTPLRQLTKQQGFILWRRMFGLFTFFYATCHLLLWSGMERHFSFALMGKDIVERPAIVFGLFNYVLLCILAITSNQAMVRKLGRNWRRLHRLVYIVAVFAVIHAIFMQRSDASIADIYAFTAVVFILLVWRIVAQRIRQQRIQQQLQAIKPK
ncbi:sulfite oxidase [Pelistega indica]|uniref:Protein-methionine-sulfoxide reductase heme-binding subunit MsrQ n=1 Tax=Pelistega indica TaxID=1414851 RepID=V8GAA8_9BURK|nr:protein-methionine-sulfoxide reductase heme-binding subunit MsrQ [Pelistega indica]ETD72888.1 sulfite oxidase [Pelistega indica]